ncbi:tetratricopeptide repeat protein [Nonomuraea fuscirosea]|uniref:tetratricopeptide repeat protein n=1 Tax=Nonomuraea fuscirosea TaxID=1291556 RepID=UPI0034251FDC
MRVSGSPGWSPGSSAPRPEAGAAGDGRAGGRPRRAGQQEDDGGDDGEGCRVGEAACDPARDGRRGRPGQVRDGGDSRNDLVGAYELAGDLEQAIPLYEVTLADWERVLGADNPSTPARPGAQYPDDPRHQRHADRSHHHRDRLHALHRDVNRGPQLEPPGTPSRPSRRTGSAGPVRAQGRGSVMVGRCSASSTGGCCGPAWSGLTSRAGTPEAPLRLRRS